jgi:hypothetical protein
MPAIVMAKPFLHCHHRFKNGKDHCYWSIAEKVRTARGWVQNNLGADLLKRRPDLRRLTGSSLLQLRKSG